MFKIAILTIGDEICIGQITNTNAAWIAQQCTQIGADVTLHSTIKDEKQELINELQRLSSKVDYIIITGGLGPTHDDITKAVLTDFFSDSLVRNTEAEQNIRDIFNRRGFQITERNLAQADLPSKCIPLINKQGTASGMLFKYKSTFIVSLPGVPVEMKGLIENYTIAHIKELISQSKHDIALYKVLKTSGIGESTLADKINISQSMLENASLAFLPSYQGVRLRIGAFAASYDTAHSIIDRIEAHIRETAGEFIYAEGEISLTSNVGQMLKKRKLTVATAESCTAGLLAAEFTDVSGSSSYFLGGCVAYSNDIKINILKVNPDTIEKFGAVSQETAQQMSENAKSIFSSDFAISITGIAGPGGGTPEKPVGTVCISVAAPHRTTTKTFNLGNNRNINRQRSVASALMMLRDEILNHDSNIPENK